MSAVGYVVKSMVVTIKTGVAEPIAYECAITGVTEVESHKTVASEVACPDGSITDVGPSTWTVDIDYQVSNLPASLHRILRDNAGAVATLAVEPFPVTEPDTVITYTVTLVPGGANYTVGAFGAAKVSLPVTGSPVTTDAGL